MEGDETKNRLKNLRIKFQSTPSAWRETRLFMVLYSLRDIFQSTPSAWRETLADRGAGNTTVISIHSLRMEGDARTR